MKIEKVLVVDDSKVAHLTLRKMLTERGIEVDWVGSGEDSLTYLKDKKPNVVFMDVMMPGMDGFETTSAIKSDSSLNSPPIIMCSANTTNEDKENAAKLGAIDFLSKPYTSDELDSVLNRVRTLEAAAVVKEAAPVVAERAASNGKAASMDAHQSDQATSATADRVARKVATEVAREAAESASRKGAQAATTAAKAAAEKAVQAAVADVKKSVTDEVMASVNTLVMQKLVDQRVEMPDSGKLRKDILRDAKAQIAGEVEKAVATALTGDAIKQQLAQLVQTKALPAVEQAARKEAVSTSEQMVAEMMENSRPAGGSSLAVASLIIGLMALGGTAAMYYLNYMQ